MNDRLPAFDLRNSFTGRDIYQFVGRTSRTASEAFKDAQYACPITKYKDDYHIALERFVGSFFHLSLSAMFGGILVGIVYWITR